MLLRFSLHVLVVAALFSAVSIAVPAQSKRNTRTSSAPNPAATPEPTPTPRETVKTNRRPETVTVENPHAGEPVYFYEFDRPGFTFGKILIEHDEGGLGKISFLKETNPDLITDPLSISPVTLKNIKEALATLNFLDSREEYQYSRDYSNLGNMTFTQKSGGRQRSVKYNWTDNKAAKALMDEYRRVANEYTWRFDILSARETQPLLTPGLMDLMDSYVKRGEISDPPHLLPFLRDLSNDERLPLMARNRALNIVRAIEKAKK